MRFQKEKIIDVIRPLYWFFFVFFAKTSLLFQIYPSKYFCSTFQHFCKCETELLLVEHAVLSCTCRQTWDFCLVLDDRQVSIILTRLFKNFSSAEYNEMRHARIAHTCSSIVQNKYCTYQGLESWSMIHFVASSITLRLLRASR